MLAGTIMTREADTYERHAAPLTGRFTRHVLAAAGGLAGACVVDVACGTGLASREAAARGARAVVGLDLLDWMTERARLRFRERGRDAQDSDERDGAAAGSGKRGATGLHVARMDATRLGMRSEWADVTLCQFGLMFMAEREQAARELHRVTRPAGTVVCAVWSTPDHASQLAAFLDVAGEVVLGRPLAREHAIFGLGGDGALAELLSRAGFTDVRESRPNEIDARGGIEEYWTRMSSTVGFRVEDGPDARVATADRLPESVQREMRDRLAERVASYARPDCTLAFPMQAVIVVARRPT